jgi:hypothetical protein
VTDKNHITIDAGPGGRKETFAPEEAMQTARRYHHAAGELEALHRRMIRKQSLPRWVPLSCLVILSKTSIGRRVAGLVNNGCTRVVTSSSAPVDRSGLLSHGRDSELPWLRLFHVFRRAV